MPTRTSPLAALLIDPQTAGGLLAGVPAERAAPASPSCARLGYRAAEIGRCRMPVSGAAPRVSTSIAGAAAPAGCRSPRNDRGARRACGLPSVDRVLRSDAATLIERYGRALVARRGARRARRAARGGEGASDRRSSSPTARRRSRALMRQSQRRVFNLTGTVLHTNLGRAPLPEEAIAAAVEAMRDADDARIRDRRAASAASATTMSRGWLTRLTGAEAALAVNNNAGALVLALEHARRRARDDRVARRADRDRRRVSPARHHGARRHDGCARSAPPTAPICATSPPRSGRRPG